MMGKRLSLHPLKFGQVISDVLTIKPEPKELKPRLNKPLKNNRKVKKRST